MTLKPARLLVVLLAAVALPVLAQNLAVVNGKPVPSSRADAMAKQMASQGQQDTPQLRAMIKEELVNREILIQEADKQGLASNADVKSQIEIARQSIVIRALVTDYLKKNPVSDAEIKAEYDKFKASAGDKEYRARHILVEKEDDAKAIITKLKGGAKFEDLAKQSKDTGSAANGGDLDWASPASFVKPFSDAMVALQKGQMTDTPVKTQFGYHVIRLEDSRPAKVPTLEEVKPQIGESLQQKKLQAYQAQLRAKAKVQ
ncbi:MAG: peptidylprolyl isomerase [Herminiimonas sp.]|nr:peptidylprolyl isomerase [Herminiimonas sp.]